MLKKQQSSGSPVTEIAALLFVVLADWEQARASWSQLVKGDRCKRTQQLRSG